MIDKMLLLVKSNIKKSKSMSIAFLLMILSTLFIYQMSCQINDGFNKIFEIKKESTNSADFCGLIPLKFYIENRNEINEFVLEEKKVTNHEVTEVLMLRNTNIILNNSENSVNGSWIIRNADRQELLSPVSLIEKLEMMPQNGVYVPYVCKTLFGFQLGNELDFSYEGKQKTYVIAGFTEDVLFGSRAFLAFDFPETQYRELKGTLTQDDFVAMLMVSLKGDVIHFGNDFINFITQKGEVDFYSSTDTEYAKSSRYSNLNVYVMIMKIASLIALVACISIIGFYMKNTIEKDLDEIGVLKAIGYTGISVIFSYIIQFVLIGLVGAIIGVSFSIMLFPTVIQGIAADIGFRWPHMFLIDIILKNIIGVTFIISIITILFSWKLIRIKPLEAFQGKTKENTTKRKHLSIAQLPFSIDNSIILQMLSFEKIKTLFSVLIVFVIVCVAGFSVILYSGVVADKNGLIQVTGAELYSVNIMPTVPSDTEDLIDSLRSEEVEKIIAAIDPGNFRLLCDDSIMASLSVYSDYNLLNNPSIFFGRYPKHENEIAISGNLANSLNKDVGDKINVTQKFQEVTMSKDYLIVGLTQGTFSGGMDIFLSLEGLKQIQPLATWESIHIYLDDETDINSYCTNIQEQFKKDISYIGNYEQIFSVQFSSIVRSVAIIVYVIMIIMLVIIIVMGFFVTSSLLLTRHKDFGIMKALGYSNMQIIKQLAKTFTFYIISGGVTSGIFLYFFADKIIILLFKNMGVHNINFQFPTIYIILMILIIACIGYITVILSALNVRKIVPWNLIQKE